MKEQPVPYQFHVLVCLNEKAPGELTKEGMRGARGDQNTGRAEPRSVAQASPLTVRVSASG